MAVTTGHRQRVRRTVLFVPATRPDRFEKALASGADAVCIDLEDAVAPARKAEARAAAVDYLQSGVLPGTPGHERPEVILRINPLGTEAGALDVAALERASVSPDAVMLPKVSGSDELLEAERRLSAMDGPGEPAVLPLIESARGLHAAEAIAQAGPSVSALVFGGLDLALELGAAPEWEPLLYARSRVVQAAALGGVGAIDMPRTDFEDADALREECASAHALGFSGKLVIHPTQVAVAQEAFMPSPGQVDWATRVVAAAEAGRSAGEGVVVLDGQMVDEPVVRAAHATLARAGVRPGTAEA